MSQPPRKSVTSGGSAVPYDPYELDPRGTISERPLNNADLQETFRSIRAQRAQQGSPRESRMTEAGWDLLSERDRWPE